MTHAAYTGKSAGTTIAFGAKTITAWRKITIEERGRGAPEMLDTTVSGDSAYVFVEDGMGSKGYESCTVTVEGLLSVTDSAESGLTESAIGSTGNLVIVKKTGEDTFTMTNAILKSFSTSHPFADVIPFTAVFELGDSAGAWS